MHMVARFGDAIDPSADAVLTRRSLPGREMDVTKTASCLNLPGLMGKGERAFDFGEV
jgi:hypothetical protein